MEFVVLYLLGVVSFVIELLIFKTIYVYDYPKRKDYSKRLPIKVWHLLLLIIVNIIPLLNISVLGSLIILLFLEKDEFYTKFYIRNSLRNDKNLRKLKKFLNREL